MAAASVQRPDIAADLGRQPQRFNSNSSPPDSDPTTPDNVSPASPRLHLNMPSHLHLQGKQLRQPRSPMYVPAVLRPTEKPARQSPPNAQIATGSPESVRSSLDNRQVQDEVRRPTLQRMLSDEWNDNGLADVTGPPSRNHWKVSDAPSVSPR